MVAFPDDMGTPDDVGTESNESYVPFVAACERFSQGIKHWSKTTHADWLRSMTKQDVIKLINASKANDKIGVGNKGHNEAVASYLTKKNWSLLYRIHEEPDLLKLQDLQQLAAECGVGLANSEGG